MICGFNTCFQLCLLNNQCLSPLGKESMHLFHIRYAVVYGLRLLCHYFWFWFSFSPTGLLIRYQVSDQTDFI